MEHRTREQWIAIYRDMPASHLAFFLASAQGALKGDTAMQGECKPEDYTMWQGWVEQDKLEIQVIEEQLAQQSAK